MHEPLTTQLLLDLLAQLHVAFPRTIGKENPAMMADVYRNGLRGVSGDAVREAVARCVQDDQYFPKVSRLREIARMIDARRSGAVRRAASWDECGVCGARVTETAKHAWVMVHHRGPHHIRDDAAEGAA